MAVFLYDQMEISEKPEESGKWLFNLLVKIKTVFKILL